MGDAPIDLAPIRGTDDTLNTLAFIWCRHPLALDMIPSNSVSLFQTRNVSHSRTVALVPCFSLRQKEQATVVVVPGALFESQSLLQYSTLLWLSLSRIID